MTDRKLPFHEWIIIVLIVLIMISLTLVTHFNSHLMPSLNEEKHLFSNEVEVHIQGAVSKPGSYTLKKGSTIKDLLLLAEPLSDADLSKIKPERILRDRQKITIPSDEMVTIYLEGAVVRTGLYSFPKGTKVEELLLLVSFEPKADLKPLKKKRKLKEGEIFIIPAKDTP